MDDVARPWLGVIILVFLTLLTGYLTACEKAVGEIKESDLDALASDALNDACYPGNPREATHAQVVELFSKLLK